MLVPNFPGVIAQINDLSEVITANSIISAGYVGEAAQGPVFKPTLCSSFSKYKEIFGQISTDYGYMGYTASVTMDSINQNYFVRVVHTIDDDETKNANFAAALFVNENESMVTPPSNGYPYAQILAAQDEPGTLFQQIDDQGNVTIDETNVFAIITKDPNEREFFISIADSTIIEEKARLAISTSVIGYKHIDFINDAAIDFDTKIQELNQALVDEGISGITIIGNLNAVTNEAYITINNSSTSPIFLSGNGLPYVGMKQGLLQSGLTVSQVFTTIGTAFDGTNIIIDMGPFTVTVDNNSEHNLIADDIVKTTFSQIDDYNGVYKVQIVSDTAFSYQIDTVSSFTTTGLRWVKYPEFNSRAFSLVVYEKVNKVYIKQEEYKYLTLYPNKDSTGASTYASDYINNNSSYIQCFINPNITDQGPKFINMKSLNGGRKGIKPTTGELINAWDLFRDRSAIFVNLLFNCGYVGKEDLSYQSKMIEIAEKRRDCFCLFDIPVTETDPEKAQDWRKNMQGFNTYRGALVSPWIKTFDSISGRTGFLMVPSAFVGKVIGSTGYPWMAPAGPNRGILTSSTTTPIGLKNYYDDIEGGLLYNDNINCIIRKPGMGYVIWGQKTLQMKSSALDRINVARTVIFIETTLVDAAQWYLFENNTEFNRTMITLQFNQFLDTIVAQDGIANYSVICNESNNTPYIIANNQLAIDIYLWVRYSIEWILISSNIMGPAATVNVSTGT